MGGILGGDFERFWMLILTDSQKNWFKKKTVYYFSGKNPLFLLVKKNRYIISPEYYFSDWGISYFNLIKIASVEQKLWRIKKWVHFGHIWDLFLDGTDFSKQFGNFSKNFGNKFLKRYVWWVQKTKNDKNSIFYLL